MSNRDYLLPGIAAIVLAISFPLYWIHLFYVGSDNFADTFRADLLSLSLSDLVFVTIGILEVYLYFSLRRSFAERLSSGTAGVLLVLMAILVILFHATVLVDVVLSITGASLQESTIDDIGYLTLIVALGVMLAYSVVGLILSVVLLLNRTGAPSLLKYFAVVLLICCLLHLSIILSPATIFVFPVALLLLAFYFLRPPQTLEMV